MSHWIVDDKGFGGIFYICSNCGQVFSSIANNAEFEECCPNCGENIDDETEYID